MKKFQEWKLSYTFVLYHNFITITIYDFIPPDTITTPQSPSLLISYLLKQSILTAERDVAFKSGNADNDAQTGSCQARSSVERSINKDSKHVSWQMMSSLLANLHHDVCTDPSAGTWNGG